MDIINQWLLVLGCANIILFMFSLVLFFPKSNIKSSFLHLPQAFLDQIMYIIIILAVVIIHIIEVNFIDPYLTMIIGTDYTPFIQTIEDDLVYHFSTIVHTPVLVVICVTSYIVIYPFTLWFVPFYSLFNRQTFALKNLAYGLILIYCIALPFYLFLPITNVYTTYAEESSLESIIPGINTFFYATTTKNNCLPSLHVTMTLLIVYIASLTKNKRLTIFAMIVAILVIISVIYLAIHWIIDVVSGGLLAGSIIILLHKYLPQDGERP